MDLLEGVASGQYFRRDTSVTTSLAAEPLTCVAYFYKPNEVLLGLPHMSDYNAEAHAQYQVLLVRSVVGFSSNFVLVVSGGNRQVRVLGCEWCLYRQVCA
jgi:hypothetical protein